MNIHDKANELAQALKESEQFVNFKKIKNALTEEEDKKIIDEFRKVQMEAYQDQMQNGRISDEMKNKLQSMYNDASKNPKVNEYLMCEERFGLLWSDIMKILSQAVEVDIR